MGRTRREDQTAGKKTVGKAPATTGSKTSVKKPSRPTPNTGPRAKPAPASDDNPRTGSSVAALRRGFLDNLFYMQGRLREVATANDNYQALAYTVRDRLLARWVRSARLFKARGARTVCYFSAEYLLGPHLGGKLLNLGLLDRARQAMHELGLDLDELIEQEEEPGLGNGGLGRLAACYMESLATLQIPAIGYGIRYEFGIFDQTIADGWQVEITDKWLRYGNPWELARPKIAFDVKLGGHTEAWTDEQGRYRVRWVPHRVVRGIAYDTPIAGFEVANVNLLRLWSAQAPESFDFQAFNHGDYYGAVEDKVGSENLTKVLYPNDEPAAGKRLRLEQQYFFVSCSLQDMLRLYLATVGPDLAGFPDKFAAQLNDTHPAIAVAELMRLLVDEHDLEWEAAWSITRRTFAYTNHTLLSEALEKWPLELFRAVLPRHLEIVFEINQRFLDAVRARHPGDEDRIARLSIIEERGERYVRMAHLACVGSHAVNGVAELHTELLKKTVLRDFHELWPKKIRNITNGVTPRRFLMLGNPALAGLVTRAIGSSWICDLRQLRALEPMAADAAFRDEWRAVQRAAKARFADFLRRHDGAIVDPDTLFDVQVKRIHEYKRQHLNVLHVITAWLRLRDGADLPPRTVIFGGKAAPGYAMAKLIIKLIHSVAEVVNHDPIVADRLKVVFVPDFNVKNAQHLYPAADLSEQVSTAGKEASGTGNMKFMMNGAVTIGTLDGANIEILREVGDESFFRFGLDAEQVIARKAAGYRPREIYAEDPLLRRVLGALEDGQFSRGDKALFRPLVDALLDRDEYLLLADYASYIDAQKRVAHAWQDKARWARMSIRNTARSGHFSSDRSIREYCEAIWRVPPLLVPLDVGEVASGCATGAPE